MAEAVSPQVVHVTIADPRLSAPVLERLVSAAAARAELPVDRVVNALTVVDQMVAAAGTVLDGGARSIAIQIGEGNLELTIDGLFDGQAEAIRDAAQLGPLGNVIDRAAKAVTTEQRGEHTALVISLD